MWVSRAFSMQGYPPWYSSSHVTATSSFQNWTPSPQILGTTMLSLWFYSLHHDADSALTQKTSVFFQLPSLVSLVSGTAALVFQVLKLLQFFFSIILILYGRRKKSGSSYCIMNIAEDLICVPINNIFDGISSMCVCFELSCVRLFVTPWCSPPGSSVHGDSPGRNTGVGSHALL